MRSRPPRLSRAGEILHAKAGRESRMARILLVDDEKVARTVYGDYLTAAGHTVTCVGSVADARAALAADRVDAVVTDLILPGRRRDGGPPAHQRAAPGRGGGGHHRAGQGGPRGARHQERRGRVPGQAGEARGAEPRGEPRADDPGAAAENAALKRHLSLVEAGQRIATTLDRERLAQARELGLPRAVRCRGRAPLVAGRRHGPAGGLRGHPGGGAAPPGRPLRRRAPGHAGSLLRRRVAGGARKGPRVPGGRGREASRLGPPRDPRRGRRDVARDLRVPGAPPCAGLESRRAVRAGGGPRLPRRPHPALQRPLPGRWCWNAR